MWKGQTMEMQMWHPLSRDDDLAEAPLAVTLLGQPLVLWRDASGQPVLMKDQCPHRGAQLSLGRVQGDGCGSSRTTGFVRETTGFVASRG